MGDPIDSMKTSTEPGKRVIDKPDHPPAGYTSFRVAEAETAEGNSQLKVGQSQGYELFCDESGRIGGEGKYPPPMAYFALGTAF